MDGIKERLIIPLSRLQAQPSLRTISSYASPSATSRTNGNGKPSPSLDKDMIFQYETCLNDCLQTNYTSLPINPSFDFYPELLKISKKYKIALNVIPTIVRINKEMHYLYTNKDKVMKSKTLEISSYEELQKFIETHLLSSGEGSPFSRWRAPTMLLLKEKNLIKKKTSSIVCASPLVVVNELVQRSVYSEIVIQPWYESREKTRIVTRVFLKPPKIQAFHAAIPENVDEFKEEGQVINKAKDCVLSAIEDQCKRLFELLYKLYFNPSKLKLEGMVLDFVQSGSATYMLERIRGYRTSALRDVLGQSTGFGTSAFNMDPSRKCYGDFCYFTGSKSNFQQGLTKAISQIVKAPRQATLLYKDIDVYNKDFELYERYSETKKFKEHYPLVGEPIKKRAKARLSEAAPYLYDVVPVCEHCYYVYTLYRFKKEKLRLPRPLEYLRGIAPENWTEENFTMLAAACDPQQSTFGMLKIYYALPEELQDEGLKNHAAGLAHKILLRKQLDSQRYERNREDLNRMLEEYREKKMAETVREVAKKNTKKISLKTFRYPLRKNASLPRLVTKPIQSSPELPYMTKPAKPTINDFFEVKNVYYDALRKMRRSNPSFFQHL